MAELIRLHIHSWTHPAAQTQWGFVLYNVSRILYTSHGADPLGPDGAAALAAPRAAYRGDCAAAERDFPSRPQPDSLYRRLVAGATCIEYTLSHILYVYRRLVAGATL